MLSEIVVVSRPHLQNKSNNTQGDSKQLEIAAVTFLAVGIKTKLEIESRLETIKKYKDGLLHGQIR